MLYHAIDFNSLIHTCIGKIVQLCKDVGSFVYVQWDIFVESTFRYHIIEVQILTPLFNIKLFHVSVKFGKQYFESS